MLQLLKCLRSDERGVTVIEYGVLASLIIVAAITVIGTVGANVNTVFTSIAAAL